MSKDKSKMLAQRNLARDMKRLEREFKIVKTEIKKIKEILVNRQ
jgi:hypothetical protein